MCSFVTMYCVYVLVCVYVMKEVKYKYVYKQINK